MSRGAKVAYHVEPRWLATRSHGKPPTTSIRAFTFYVGVIIIFLFLKIEINEKLMFEYKLKIYFDSIFL